MKRYFLKSALLILSMAAFISCDEDTVTYGGRNFVSFEQVASNKISFFEHLGTSQIPVNIAFPVNHNVTVKFNVTSSNAQAGVDYTLPSNEVVIPAGATSANILINVVDNEVMNDSKALEITLTEISDSSITIGMEDAGSKFKRFLIVNDDCTTNFFDFVGLFSVASSGTDLGTATVDVNDNGDCNIIRIEGVLDNQLQNPTDTYIEFTMTPGAGTNGANQGTLSSVQQAYCVDCYTYQGNPQTFLFTGSGSFLVNASTTRLIVSGTLDAASGVAGLQGIPTSVTLIKIKE